MSRGIPKAVSMHMAQNAFARCAEKVNTRKNLTLNRQAVGEVVSYCTMIAANDTLDFNRDKQERLCTEMNHRAEVYTVEMSAYGQPKAREKLRERTAPMLDKPFVLPAGQYPRKQREKDALAERRAAGDLVIRFFIEALDSMGYDRAQINSTVEEARKNYEQFLEWAKDGGVCGVYQTGPVCRSDDRRQYGGCACARCRAYLLDRILTVRSVGGQNAGRRNENDFALLWRD